MFVATRHGGTPEYFTKLDGIVRRWEREDHQVLYESVDGLDPDADLTADERRVLHDLELMEREQKRWVERRGLVHQADHLTPEPSWLRADISGRELLRRMTEVSGFTWGKRAERVLLEYRDRVLIQALQSWENREDLVVIFGVGHFKGLGRYLIDKGYESVEELWLTAHRIG